MNEGEFLFTNLQDRRRMRLLVIEDIIYHVTLRESIICFTRLGLYCSGRLGDIHMT